MRYISGTKLDERIIRCDLDLGYRDGRQFGRGKSGGQVCTSNSCILLDPNAPMAIGGEEWKHALAPTEATHKRARSPDDEDDGSRQRARVDEDTGRM